MYDLEKYCQNIFNKSFDDIIKGINKEDYFSFSIPKKKGVRKIYTLPNESELKKLQKLLLNRVFSGYSFPTPVKGFLKGESYKNFLLPHIGSKYFIRIDIQDFFNSIKYKHVEEFLEDVVTINDGEQKKNLINLIWEIVSYNESIPQGVITSPIISNLIFRKLDQRILKYCQLFNIEYTRYADDLLFSSQTFNFIKQKWFVKKIKYILSSKKFRINYNKIKYGYKEISLNGFVVSSTDIRLSRSRLFDVRRILSFIKKHPPITDQETYLHGINKLELKHYNIILYPFTSYYRLIQFLSGFRSFIISWIDDEIYNKESQRNLQKLICRIEKAISILSDLC